MATRKECIRIENAARIIRDAKVLEAKSDILDRLSRMYEHGLLMW